tara:strand:+ start:633 stop:839 length:207 start_codon:yes stop_codon:yes gene_type:complete
MEDKEKIYLSFLIVLLIIFAICKCLFCWDDKNKINPENQPSTYSPPSPPSTKPPPSPIMSDNLLRNHL